MVQREVSNSWNWQSQLMHNNVGIHEKCKCLNGFVQIELTFFIMGKLLQGCELVVVANFESNFKTQGAVSVLVVVSRLTKRGVCMI